jgi:membrane protein
MDTRTTREPGEPPRTDDPSRSLADLFRELGAESRRLLKQELELARAELKRALGQLSAGAKQVGIGSAVALVGVLTLTAFLIVGLGALLANYWLAALIVSLVLLGVGGFLIYGGISKLTAAELAPRETMDSLRATGEWAGREAAELRQSLATELPVGNGSGAGTLEPAMPGTRPALPPAGETLASRPGREQFQRDREWAEAERASESRGREGGWKGLLKRVGKESMRDDVLGEAAKVAYYAFLALPPALLVILSLTGFFGGQGAATWLTERLEAALPDAAQELVDTFVTQVVHEQAPGPFSIGLLLALWAASALFMSLGDSLNRTYNVTEDRSWVKRRAMAVGVMLAAVTLMIVASVSLIMGPQIANTLQLWGAAELAWNILQWPLAFLFVAGAFFIVYYVLPNRDQSAFRGELFKASMIAAGLWLLATAAFRLYVANFASYSETYGFLGAVIVLLLWLYMTGVVALVGGEFASEMEGDAA